MDIENYREQIDNMKDDFSRRFHRQARAFREYCSAPGNSREQRDEALENEVDSVLEMLECRYVFWKDHVDRNLAAVKQFLELQLPEERFGADWCVEFWGGLDWCYLRGNKLSDIPFADALDYTCASILQIYSTCVRRWTRKKVESVRRRARSRLARHHKGIRVSAGDHSRYGFPATLTLHVRVCD